MKYKAHKQFIKTYKKLPKKIQDKVDERIILFLQDPFLDILQNHALKGNFYDCRSINITGDYRIIYRPIDGYWVLFMDVGTHSQLYG